MSHRPVTVGRFPNGGLAYYVEEWPRNENVYHDFNGLRLAVAESRCTRGPAADFQVERPGARAQWSRVPGPGQLSRVGCSGATIKSDIPVRELKLERRLGVTTSGKAPRPAGKHSPASHVPMRETT